MGETEKTPKTSWFTGVRQEFKKIIWPEKKTVARQAAAVVAVSIVTGLIIAILNFLIQYGVDFLVNLSI